MEKWQPVAGFENYIASSDGRVINTETGRILKHRTNARGYLIVTLSNGGTTKQFKSHRLIAMTFIPNPDNKPFVNHKNGIKSDNRIENMEWCTQRENIQHSIHILKTFPTGSKNYASKLTEEKVVEIRRLSMSGIRNHAIAEKFGVHSRTINQIVKRERWKHVA